MDFKHTHKIGEYIVKPAAHLDADTLKEYQISRDTIYNVLSSYPTIGVKKVKLDIECDDGEIRSIPRENFKKVNTESDS